MRRHVVVIGLWLGLAGCAGKPTTYLTLAPVPAQNTWPGVGAKPVAVSRVQMPPAIDRRQFTTASGAATLKVAGKVEWAGPLGSMAQQVLARDLAARLPHGVVLMPGDPVPPGGARQVRVNIQTFWSDESGRVTLVADWSVADGNKPASPRRFRTSVQGGAEPGKEAASMSAALGQLADRIAHGLS